MRKKICELWLGPTGDAIYHFHDSYEDEHPTIVGPPTYLPDDRVDSGFVFVFLRASNPAWHSCVLQSVVSQFERSELHMGNCPQPMGGRFTEVPKNRKSILERLNERAGKMHGVKIALKIDFGDRFLAKLALGFGALELDASFLVSDDAKKLRDFLWERDRERRDRLRLRGTTFLGSPEKGLSEVLSIEFGHTIAMIPVDGRLALFVSFYGKSTAVIIVSEDKNHWRKIGDGIVYAIVPGYRLAVGPVNLPQYISAIHGIQGAPQELVDVLAKTRRQPELPEYDIQREELKSQMKQYLREYAYSLWEKRGRPSGDPQKDWYDARKQLG